MWRLCREFYERRKVLFFEKTNRETFISDLVFRWAFSSSRRARPAITVFLLLFFQKKKSLLLLCVVFCPAARDPYLWPFAPDSPWNTPIGSGAVFSPLEDTRTQDLLAGHTSIRAGAWGMPIYLAREADPMVHVHDEENARDFLARIPVSARPDPMADAHFFVVEPSHLFALEMYRARLQAKGDVVARRAFRVSLTGPGMFLRDGRFPGVRAMDASGMGGVLRVWEIHVGAIRHALTFMLPFNRLKHGPVWPSSREDFFGARVYTGHVPIGTLIAIPSDVDIGALALTPAGHVLARALQDFGAYCDDSVGTDGIVMSAEGAAEGLPELADMRRDFPVLHRYLRVVLNNTSATPGGGGTPRVSPPGGFATIQ
jgi:hypothetical protein